MKFINKYFLGNKLIGVLVYVIITIGCHEKIPKVKSEKNLTQAPNYWHSDTLFSDEPSFHYSWRVTLSKNDSSIEYFVEGKSNKEFVPLALECMQIIDKRNDKLLYITFCDFPKIKSELDSNYCKFFPRSNFSFEYRHHDESFICYEDNIRIADSIFNVWCPSR